MKKRDVLNSLSPIVAGHKDDPVKATEMVLEWLEAKGLILISTDDNGDEWIYQHD